MLTSIPGPGSARRAAPMGMSGEAAIAMPTAIRPPAPSPRPCAPGISATSRARVMPRARKTGNSAESRMSWRLSSWTMTARAMSPASPANSASAAACGRMARWVAAVAPDRLTRSILPPLAGYRFASAAAADRNLSMLAPGRSRMPAWSP